MVEPWFNPNLWAWLPGTLIGVLGGVWGSMVGVLAPKGKARSFVLGSGVVLLGFATLCLIAGGVALSAGQPYGVWYGLMLPGFIGPCVIGSLLPVVLHRYREAEQRQMKAHDLDV